MERSPLGLRTPATSAFEQGSTHRTKHPPRCLGTGEIFEPMFGHLAAIYRTAHEAIDRIAERKCRGLVARSQRLKQLLRRRN